MTSEEYTKITMYLVHQGTLIDNDVLEAEEDFRFTPSPWYAMRYALAKERKKCFQRFSNHLVQLLNMRR